MRPERRDRALNSSWAWRRPRPGAVAVLCAIWLVQHAPSVASGQMAIKVKGVVVNADTFKPPDQTTEGDIFVASMRGSVRSGPPVKLDAKGHYELSVDTKNLDFRLEFFQEGDRVKYTFVQILRLADHQNMVINVSMARTDSKKRNVAHDRMHLSTIESQLAASGKTPGKELARRYGPALEVLDPRVWKGDAAMLAVDLDRTLKLLQRDTPRLTLLPDRSVVMSMPDLRVFVVRPAKEEKWLLPGAAPFWGHFKFADEGRQIVGHAGDKVLLWDTPKGSGPNKGPQRLDVGGGRVSGLTVSPDGFLMAVGTTSGVVSTMRQRRGSWQKGPTFAAGTGAIRDIAFAPDNRSLAVVGLAGVAELWDLERDAATLRREVDAPFVNCVAFSPKSRRFAIGTGLVGPGSIWLVDVDGQNIKELFRTEAGGVTSLAYTPDGNFLIAGSAFADTIYVIDANRGQVVHRDRENKGVFSITPPEVAGNPSIVLIRGKDPVVMDLHKFMR